MITIINSQGGSDELLFAVQKGLNRLSIGLEIDVTIEVTDRHGMYNDMIIITYSLALFNQMDVNLIQQSLSPGQLIHD